MTDIRWTIQIKCDSDPTGWTTLVDCEPDEQIARASFATCVQNGCTTRLLKSTVELVAQYPGAIA